MTRQRKRDLLEMSQEANFGQTTAAAMEQLPSPSGIQDRVQALGTMAAESHTQHLLQRRALIMVSFAAAQGSPHSTPVPVARPSPQVTTPHCAPLLSAGWELPQTASPGQRQMLNFLQLPKKLSGKKSCKKKQEWETPCKCTSLGQGDLGAEKGEGADGDSEGGSSGLTPRCAQHSS